MRAIAKYSGRDMEIFFGTVDVSGGGRNLEIAENADEIDVTTYGSDDREYIAGMTDRNATMEVLDDTEAVNIRNAVKTGQTGTLKWFPLGSSSGMPVFTINTAIVLERSFSYPYDDAVTMSVSMRLSGAPVEAAV